MLVIYKTKTKKEVEKLNLVEPSKGAGDSSLISIAFIRCSPCHAHIINENLLNYIACRIICKAS